MVIKNKLDQWCDSVLEAGWLAALVVAPMFFNVFSSRVFEPDKISLVRTIALSMIVVWLIKVANGGYSWLPAFATSTDDQPSGGNWRGFLRNPFFVPAALLIVAYLLSTALSVAGFVSWFGSYQRLQGTYSFLAYVTIGGLTAATLRRPEQIRRLQHAIIITSVACSIYGILQRWDVDPLPWGGDVTTRVAGNAGNAIFLAAYLIVAFFVNLERLFTSFVRLLGIGRPEVGDAQDGQSVVALIAYLLVWVVQSAAILMTQSRGPWLGWFLGIFLFVLMTFSAVRPRFYRAVTTAVVSVAAAGAIFLIVANTVPTLAFLRALPYIGRLTSVLELEEGTGKVRALIWEGASQMLLPHSPLTFPDGHQDSINLIRPLVGYGPEAMWIAYNRFYPPDLAHLEARNASPDRSHNETWDSLVITGLLGFAAYMAVFISIFYWALRWLGLIAGRRDTILFGVLLALGALVSTVGFYIFDDYQLRLFGVALPFGIIAGFAVYISAAAFMHAGTRPDRAELPRQILLIALLAAIVAHYLEIHFGIAIGATRTTFWILTATFMVVGMRLAQVQHTELSGSAVDDDASSSAAPAATAQAGKSAKARPRVQTPPPRRSRRPAGNAPMLPATVLTDVLVFFTFVYIYTTNASGSNDAFSVLSSSVFQQPANGQLANNPAIFVLMFLTWLLAATIGLVGESWSHRKAPGGAWWARGYGLHALVVWGAWLVYGLIQSYRLTPLTAAPGTTNQEFLNLQLERVGGHFGFFTFVVVVWMLAAGTAYAWPWLRERGISIARRPLWAALAGAAGAALAIFLVYTVNVNLVKADIVYKQGQQFDNQGNWVNSIELYRRALATRKTEDQYMLFLGRALLEQAKQAQPSGIFNLPENATIDDVLSLTPEQVSQMGRDQLLRATEVVLLDAQSVNPLNTDHTANLARLYRTWADLVAGDPAQHQAMLDKSIAMYEKAVMLSPNAAHLWNERGNAFLASGQNDQALASYEKSLSLDQLFEQTYLLLADLLERTGQNDRLTAILQQGIDTFSNAHAPTAVAQLLSYLSVAQARGGDLDGAAATNLRMLEIMPNNAGALRNLAVIARDQGNADKAIDWANQAIAVTDPTNVAELKPLYQLMAELYQTRGETEQVAAQYERMRQLDPNDSAVLQTLVNLYGDLQDDAHQAEVAQTLMQLDPQNYEYPLVASQALARLNRGQEALPFAQQALALAPEDQKPAITELIRQLGGS